MVEGGSIAEELFHAIRLKDYCAYMSKLNKGDIISIKEFKEHNYSCHYELNSKICYHDRKINQDHVYDIFSEFSGDDASTVKMNMLDEVTQNYDWYESRGRVILTIQGKDLTGWLSYHLDNKNACADELCIYALSHLYDRPHRRFGKKQAMVYHPTNW